MQKAQTKIMVFGTFDILHPGHVHFFKQARKLARNPFLIVSVARDVNVRKIKGSAPAYSEGMRVHFVESTGLADKVVLGSVDNHIQHILEESPDIIALGYDQAGEYVDSTLKYFEDNNVSIRVVTLKAHRPDTFKSSLYKKRLKERGA